MIKNILDWMLLDRETRNLQKINRIWESFNNSSKENVEELVSFLNDIERIETNEHKLKVALFKGLCITYINYSLSDS